MNLAQCLVELGYKPKTDFLVQDDGEGPYIKEWYHSDRKPTKTKLKKVENKAAVRINKVVADREFKGEIARIDTTDLLTELLETLERKNIISFAELTPETQATRLKIKELKDKLH